MEPRQRIWTLLQQSLGGVKVPPGIRRSIEDKYDDALLEIVAQEMPEYLSQFEDTTGRVACIYTLAQMVRDGEWPRNRVPVLTQPATPVTPPVIYHLRPIGFVSDPLVRECPPLIQCLVEARLQGTNLCVDYALAGALATVAAITGNRLRFTSWGDDSHFSNIYIVLVGESGRSLKSKVLKWVKALLSDVDPHVLGPDEGSVEALIRDLSEHPSRIWIKDEFAGLLASMKGIDYLKPVRELLLSLYDHVGIYRRHLMRNTFTCNNPALSFFASIQPEVMGEELFSGRNVDSGFVNRLLLVPGESLPDRWPAIVDYPVYRGGIVSRLASLSREGAVTVSAANLLTAAQQWEGKEVAEFGIYGDWIARRGAIHALKIAALLQAADGWPAHVIEEQWVYVALGILSRWYKASAQVIAVVHLKQPGERDRRDFYKAVCTHTHNGSGPVTIGVLAGEMQVSKRKAEEYVADLIGRQWVMLNEDEGTQIVACIPSEQCVK